MWGFSTLDFFFVRHRLSTLTQFVCPGIRAAAEEFRQLVIKQEEEKGQSHVVSMVVLRTHYLEDQLSAALAAMPTDASLVQGTIRQVR